MEKEETIAGYFVRQSGLLDGDYCRPWGAIMRCADGVCIRSSNETEEWRFPDGSRLEVGFSDCREINASDDSEEN